MSSPAAPDKGGFERRWRSRFEQFAETNENDAGISGWSEAGLGARLRHFSRVWRTEARGLWLDAGCGPGTYTRHLAEGGQEVVALDYSLPTLRKAVARCPGTRLWALGDVNALPLPAGRFDGVLCFGVLQALADPEPALRELARVLRPGGEFWVDALNAWFAPNLFDRWRRRLRGKPLHLRYDSPGRILELLRGWGFQGVVLDWVPIAPSRLAFLQPFLESPWLRGLLRLVPGLGRMGAHAFVVRARKR